ncbi:EamA family transporter, partial [Actinocorallia lasiicapitis]
MKRGVLLAVLSSLCFGASGPCGKALVGAGFSPLQAAWLRIAGAALVVVLLAWAVRGRAGWGAARPQLGRIIGYGLTGVVGCQALYFVAASRLPVGIASLLEFTGPVLLLLWVGVVRRLPVRRSAAVGVSVAVAGL